MVPFCDWKHFDAVLVSSFSAELDDKKLREDIKKSVSSPFKEHKLNEFFVDFHFYNFAFCKQEAFDERKTSTLLSILNDIFLNDMMTSDPSNTMSQSFEKFKTDLLRHSVERPPKSIKIFEREEVGKILHFVTESYYRRFRLYKYIFTGKVVRRYTQVMPQEVEIPRLFPSQSSAIAIKSSNDIEE